MIRLYTDNFSELIINGMANYVISNKLSTKYQLCCLMSKEQENYNFLIFTNPLFLTCHVTSDYTGHMCCVYYIHPISDVTHSLHTGHLTRDRCFTKFTRVSRTCFYCSDVTDRILYAACPQHSTALNVTPNS